MDGQADTRVGARTDRCTPPLTPRVRRAVAGYAGLLCSPEQKKRAPDMYAKEMTKDEFIKALKAENNMIAWILRHVRGMGR